MSGKGRGFKIGIVLLFIFGGILAVIAGYYLGQFAMGAFMSGIEPAHDSDTDDPSLGQPPVDEPDEDDDDAPVSVPVETVYVRLPVVTLYRVQVGAFSERDNALELVADLRLEGIYAYATVDSPYRVITAIASDRDCLAVTEPTLTDLRLPVYAGQWQMVSEFELTGPASYIDWYADSFKTVGQLIKRQADVWSQVLSGQDVSADIISELESDVRSLNSSVAVQTVAEDMQLQHEDMKDLIDTAVRSVFELRTISADTIVEKWPGSMAQFVELVGKYERLYLNFSQ